MIPESAEVAEARMDEEACAITHRTLDERHHGLSTGPHGWLVDVAVVAVMIAALALLMLGATVLGELAGGWPA